MGRLADVDLEESPRPSSVVFMPQHPSMPFLNRVSVGLLIGIFLAQTLLAMAGTAPVRDEDLHITAGYAYWRFGRGTINYEQPPLVKILAAVPLLFLRPHIDPLPTSERQQVFSSYATRFFLLNKDRVDLILFLARLPITVLAAALGVVIFVWSREAFGPRAGGVALLLYSFEPNFIGHSGSVFMDVPLAAFSFFSVYTLWRWCQRPTTTGVLVSGIALGLALLTKFPALLLLPVFALLVGYELLQHMHRGEAVSRYIKGLAGIYLIALVVVLLVYTAFFGTEHLATSGRPNYALRAVLGLTHRLPAAVERPAEAAVSFLAGHLPIVGMDYVRGVFWQQRNASTGAPSFLLGRYSSHSWWYYHFVAVSVKSTMPMLLLIAVRILLFRRLPWQPVEGFFVIPILATGIVGMLSPFGFGIRHVLPAYPFLVLMVSRLGAVTVKRQHLWNGFLAALLIWHAVSALRIYPYYFAYRNEIAGGPVQGRRYVVDESGQNLKRLAAYLKRRGEGPVYLSVFTTTDPATYNIRALPLPADGRCRTGTIAISDTHLWGIPFEDKQAFAWLQSRHPRAVLGYSISMYDIESCPVPPQGR